MGYCYCNEFHKKNKTPIVENRGFEMVLVPADQFLPIVGNEHASLGS
jgi:hypothetical protein